jgi:hypothetical protein
MPFAKKNVKLQSLKQLFKKNSLHYAFKNQSWNSHGAHLGSHMVVSGEITFTKLIDKSLVL